MDYQPYKSLLVNLNRQLSGPLDVSSVFTNEADLKYYITNGKETNGISSYWENRSTYPYEGQIISLVTDKEVLLFKLIASKSEPGTFDTIPLIDQTHIENLEKKMFVCLTQKEYDELGEIDPNTPYLIIEG